VVALTTTPRIARVVRGAVTPVVERDCVGAAEALGESRWHILRKELLPNVAAPLLVEASLRIAYSIALIGAMGFLGIVPDLLQPNWGVMINENRGSMANQPWPVILPVMAIAILTVMMLYVTMVYGPIAAFLVEMFPTKIRYTSMSLPYHIGNGWFGGMLPLLATAIVAWTGNIYAGLWYPIAVAVMTVVIGFVFLKDTKDVDINHT
jgi:ABC-type antimicrobial peptide transport system permease subunit